MSLLNDIARWKRLGAITDAQHDVLAAIVRKERFTVHTELTAILYLGVVSSVVGIGWTIQTYFARLGDTSILAALTLAFVASLAVTASASRDALLRVTSRSRRSLRSTMSCTSAA